jgi:hypothetical protein
MRVQAKITEEKIEVAASANQEKIEVVAKMIEQQGSIELQYRTRLESISIPIAIYKKSTGWKIEEYFASEKQAFYLSDVIINGSKNREHFKIFERKLRDIYENKFENLRIKKRVVKEVDLTEFEVVLEVDFLKNVNNEWQRKIWLNMGSESLKSLREIMSYAEQRLKKHNCQKAKIWLSFIGGKIILEEEWNQLKSEDIVSYIGKMIQIWKILTVRDVLRGLNLGQEKFNLCRGALIRLENVGAVKQIDKHKFKLTEKKNLEKRGVKILTEKEIALAKTKAKDMASR